MKKKAKLINEEIEFIKSSGNLFKDVGFENADAKRLQFRSFLMVALMKYIQNENITQTEAAKRFGVSQSRISNLVHCRTDLFSTEMLLDMLEKVGFKIYEKMQLNVSEMISQSWFTVLPLKPKILIRHKNR
jgi:predicted XRE-type DNA-binding protein